MKMRVRNARYQDVHHIVAVLMASAEKQSYLALPPIQEPHIYNYLNYHIARGEVFVVIASSGKDDAKMAGVLILEPTVFPWNQQHQIYTTSLVAVHPNFKAQGAGKLLVSEVLSIAKRDRVPMVLRPTPGIDHGITEKELIEAGFHEGSGAYCFQPPPADVPAPPEVPIENAAE